MQAEKMIDSYDGFHLYARKDTSENAKAVAVVVHGLCEHQGRYNYLTEKLNEHNFSVYRFDHRGHGKSDGERAYLKDFNCLTDDTNFIVDLTKKENPKLPVFLIGHSMGGFTVACYGAKYPGKVNGLVLSGALTNDVAGAFKQIPDGLDPHKTFPNELTDNICRDPKVCKAYADDPLRCHVITAGLIYAMQDGVRWLGENAGEFKDPALLMHGECDKIVSYKDSCKFFTMIGSQDKQLKIYGKCYHEIMNEYCRDEVIGDVIRWIENRIQR